MIKKVINILVFSFIFSQIFVVSSPMFSFGQEDPSFYDPPLLLRIHIEDREKQIPLLASFHYDVAGINSKESTVDIVGNYDIYLNLTATGFETDIVKDLTPTTDEILALQDYLDPYETEQKLEEYETDYPDIAKRFTYSTTEEGRTIWDMKISDNVATEEDEPAIIFVGQHHAREVMTPEIAIDIIDYLLTNYPSDPQVQYWVDNFEIWVRPCHNPDGTNWVFTEYNMWRKNRHDNGDGTYGVDNNRNYPFKWGSCYGSSAWPDAEDYRGPSPASELETQGIMALTEEHRPVMNISYHSHGQLVLHPYGCSNVYQSPHEKKVTRDISSTMASLITRDSGSGYYENGTGWELIYAVDGEMNDWFYGEMGSIGFTYEVNTSFQPDYDTWRDSTILRHRPSWQYILDRLDGPSIYGHTYDACSGDPLSADLSLDEVFFTNGEFTRTSEPLYGRYQWMTMPGLFHVNFSKEGYYPQNWPVNVGFTKALKEAYLVPEGSYNLEYFSHTIDDSAGDRDDEADPGETVIMPITIYATGSDVTSISATLTSSDPYVSILDGSALFPDLSAGETGESSADHFSFSVLSDAPDGHEAEFSLSYSSSQTLCQPESTFKVKISKGFSSCPFVAESLDSDPDWTIENNGTNGWEFGPPTGSSGPPSAYTGTNVYGTNLDGSYGNNGDFVLTTEPFDLRSIRNAELKFMRWLENEAAFDIAFIELSVDGVEYHEIWKGFGRDTQWEEYRYDISTLADQTDMVTIRFRLQSDSSTAWSGFYIDDLEICGEEIPSAAGKVKYSSHAVDDSDPNYGNNNGSIDLGETVRMTLTVRNTKDTEATSVSGLLTTTTPGITINNNYAIFPNIDSGSVADSMLPHFTFTIGSECGQDIDFTLETFYDDGSSATSQFQVKVGILAWDTILDDDMETDMGWTTESNATFGYWVRENPYGVNKKDATEVQPEDDTTLDPGVTCWVTGNPRPRGKYKDPEDGDVDGGYVRLISPSFDGTGAHSLGLDLNRWFYKEITTNPYDVSYFQIDISNNGGSTYHELEKLESSANIWMPVHYELTQFTAPSSEMSIRMTVEENFTTGFGDTILEGLIDDVRIVRESFECDSFSPPAMLPPNPIGNTLTVMKKETHVYLEWISPLSDAEHDIATSYRVYRSTRPDADFVEIGFPTSPFYLDAYALTEGENYYYKVKAENSGGLSN